MIIRGYMHSTLDFIASCYFNCSIMAINVKNKHAYVQYFKIYTLFSPFTRIMNFVLFQPSLEGYEEFLREKCNEKVVLQIAEK